MANYRQNSPIKFIKNLYRKWMFYRWKKTFEYCRELDIDSQYTEYAYKKMNEYYWLTEQRWTLDKPTRRKLEDY